MKKIALLISVIATAFVLASCATKTAPQAPAASSTQTAPVSAKHHHHHHHDYKGEG